MPVTTSSLLNMFVSINFYCFQKAGVMCVWNWSPCWAIILPLSYIHSKSQARAFCCNAHSRPYPCTEGKGPLCNPTIKCLPVTYALSCHVSLFKVLWHISPDSGLNFLLSCFSCPSLEFTQHFQTSSFSVAATHTFQPSHKSRFSLENLFCNMST